MAHKTFTPRTSGAGRCLYRPAPFGAILGQKKLGSRLFLLVATERERWRTVAGHAISRARWRCILAITAAPEDELAILALSNAVPAWATETSIVHESALTPPLITRYEQEAITWQTPPT